MADDTRNYVYFLVRSDFHGYVDTASAITIFASSVLWKYLRKNLFEFLAFKRHSLRYYD